MGESDMSGVEFYYEGKMLLVRCESLSHFIEEDVSISATLFVGDIRRGLLVNTENGDVRAVHYTHKGMLDKGYLFNCTCDLADAKLDALMATSVSLKSDVETMYDNDLPHEAREASSHE